MDEILEILEELNLDADVSSCETLVDDGILSSLGMRRDGSLKAEQTGNSNMIFFYQPLKAA